MNTLVAVSAISGEFYFSIKYWALSWIEVSVEIQISLYELKFCLLLKVIYASKYEYNMLMVWI